MPYTVPGVYLEEIFLKPEVILPTGIPGFVGFFKARKDEDEVPLNSHLILHRQQEFTDKYTTPDGYLTEAVVGFFENGGTFCYVVRADPDKDRKTALNEALEFLANLNHIDLVAVPDAMTLNLDDICEVQKAVIKHCEKYGDRFAILDGYGDMKSVKHQREEIAGNQTEVSAALYYPYIQVRSSTDNSLKFVPPCGHIAGIFARSDRDRGVFKAPANEEIRDAVSLEVLIDNSVQGDLNTQGINCLRAFPGRGIRVWGARTLSCDSNSNWRYINVRRLFITIKRWIDLNMVWATFEPNNPQIWVRIQRELSVYLAQLWRAGALKGKTPEEAFYVKCDAETNPPESRERGNVFTEIGFAPSSPTEFIFVRIIHRANATELS